MAIKRVPGSRMVPCIDVKEEILHEFSHLSRYLIPFIIFIGAGFYVFLSKTLNIWIDESYSLQTTATGLAYAVRQALHFELQPPLYFLLLSLWRNLNSTPFFARLLSVLCVTSTLILVGKLSKRFFKEIHPAWVVTFTAFNPFAIWAAVEIRLYALVILLSSLLILFFYDAYISETPRSKARWLYVLFSVLSLYTQYYLGFILAANALCLLILRRWKDLADYILRMLLVSLFFSPLAMLVLNQVATANRASDSPLVFHSTVKAIKVVSWNVLQFLMPLATQDWLLHLRAWASRFAVFAAVFVVIKEYRHARLPRYMMVWTLIAVSCLFFLLISLTLGPEFLWLKHCSIIFIPMVIAGFSVLQLANNRALFCVWFFMSVIFYSASLFDTYAAMSKPGDWVRVASHIMHDEKPNEPIMIFRNEFVLPFCQYYTGPNLVVPVPVKPDLQTYNLRAEVLHNEEEIDNIISKILSDDQQFWLITLPNSPLRGVDFHPEVLENYIKKHCSTIETMQFSPTKVRLMRFHKSRTYP
jgi:hypothetical protein